jgi:hypothetical protein
MMIITIRIAISDFRERFFGGGGGGGEEEAIVVIELNMFFFIFATVFSREVLWINLSESNSLLKRDNDASNFAFERLLPAFLSRDCECIKF